MIRDVFILSELSLMQELILVCQVKDYANIQKVAYKQVVKL